MKNISLEQFYTDLINDKVNYDIPEVKEYKNLYEFYEFYKEKRELFKNNIKIINNSFKKKEDNEIVSKAVDELIRMNSDGKYVRALLIALGYLSFSKSKDDSFLPLALAYETFETSVLIHDDIIDKATERRGKKTIPNSYLNEFLKFSDNEKEHISNSLGLCIGDLGFFLTNKVILDNYKNNKNLLFIMNAYNDIVIKTIKGEIIDTYLPFAQKNDKTFKVKENDVLEIYKLKTAWYTIIGPFYLGMSLVGNLEKEKKYLYDVFYNLGVAYQIKDDILGVFSKEEDLGKTSSDISEFKQTILYSYIVNKKSEYIEKLNKYYGKDNLTIEEMNIVKNIFIESGAKEYSEKIMNDLFDESIKKIDKIDFIDDYYKNILLGFILYLNLRNK